MNKAGIPWKPESRDADWVERHQKLVEQTKQHASKMKVAFLGDSIIGGWTKLGMNVWNELYKPKKAFNYGMNGDQTQHVLWRIGNGEFEKVSPKLIVLMIGTNNISVGNTPEDIAKGVEEILKMLRDKMPAAKILLLSVLPRKGQDWDTKVHAVNDQINKLADNNIIFWHDFTNDFETQFGVLKSELYLPDGLHLRAPGYEAWHKSMAPAFDKLMASNSRAPSSCRLGMNIFKMNNKPKQSRCHIQ